MWRYTIWLVVAVLLAVTERVLSAGQVAERGATEQARASDEYLQLCTLLALWGPLAAGWLLPGPFQTELAVVGALGASVGVTLRCAAMSALRGRYVLTPIHQGGAGLVTTGPYRIVRHPGYLGLLMTFIGMAALIAGLPGVMWTVPMVFGVFRRISLEEAILTEEFKDRYVQYCGSVTWRLCPCVY